MRKREKSSTFHLTPADNSRLANLCGLYNEHIRQIEQYYGVEINNRGNQFFVSGNSEEVQLAKDSIRHLYNELNNNTPLNPEQIHLFLKGQTADNALEKETEMSDTDIVEMQKIYSKQGKVKPRSINQKRYLERILQNDINFSIGPAGTGKTYLAVSCAAAALDRDQVKRILLVRPAVEAGEKLGFLPGDIAQKVDPYLRPLYDALYDLMGVEKVLRLVERGVIEIAPLAYMRGRTLNDAFIILDESQNTTPQQMKMFLTRLGFGSTAVITGDITQIDLPKGTRSGLIHAMQVLKNVDGISFTHFDAGDVVRHPLIQDIVQAYDKHEKNERGE